MKAVKILGPGEAKVVTDAPKTDNPPSDNVLVKVIAVALNPSDWKSMKRGDPSTSGLDFSGVVEATGPDTKKGYKKGDRVLGIAHGSNKLEPDNGAFSEYVMTRENLLIRIPEGKSFEEAATGGAGLLTVGQGLYQEMKLPWPNAPLKEKEQILIWGGSSATGALGIQFAKLSGFEVITTCSPANFDYVKSLGADHVFDSRSPTAGSEIRAFTHDKLYLAWDCIGEHGAPEGCAEALASKAPEGKQLRYGTIINASPNIRDDVIKTFSIGYTAAGKEVEISGKRIPAKPEHYEFMSEWFDLVGQLYQENKFKMHRVDSRPGGLEGILEGLKDLENGKVSGVKVVYRVAEP
ncbi:putative zinc-binding oxidoreductase ToxD [Periconia macrospinosa]|uniref:Putative zinc-binding oxidoreductase ToxD n=1 Tax=Periconia macrospinosa TaxID=97972 RepID=A0A2V1E395_9PLEO|nr:putative zinc-binding oxidoreductase ToxD [Periconia macrospinosa]